jgi:hypothetical protein
MMTTTNIAINVASDIKLLLVAKLLIMIPTISTINLKISDKLEVDITIFGTLGGDNGK